MDSRDLCQKKTPSVDVRGVHLDLKGTPPTARRFLELLRIFAAARYNTVLVEWEDSFPWTVDRRFRSSTAYSVTDIQQFCDRATELGLELIPLVQCLGHMETPLGVGDYAHLRECPGESGVLNPLAAGARQLVQDMVDDVLRVMPDVKYCHLGGDEAWTFGSHPDTKAYIEQHGRDALYLRHITPILINLDARGIRPILWHDMMVHWGTESLAVLAQNADLMVWGYTGHPDEVDGHYNTEHIERLHAHGSSLWGATAYKSGTGHNDDLPAITDRETNALAWVDISTRFGFNGIIATGWSRYSTTRVQTVPIDAALDILVEVGIILHDGELPPDGLAVCLDMLDGLGEKDRFLCCRDAMRELSKIRKRAWLNVQNLHEQIVLCQHDDRRRSSRRVIQDLRSVRKSVEAVGLITEKVRTAFAGLMEPVWIEEYLRTRLEPIEEQLALLGPKAKALDSD